MKMCKVTGFIAMLFIGMGTAIGMDKNPYGHLLIELREKIMFDAINVSDSIDMAVEKVKSLASTDGALAKKINDPEYCLKLIKTISNRFDKGDETVARMLGTLEAKRRIKLQDDLDTAISDVIHALYPKEFFVRFSPEVNIARIKDLIVNKGADVNFSDSVGRIPFYLLLKDIRAFKDNAIELVKLFLQYGVDPETGKYKSHIQFVWESIDSLQQEIPPFKQRKGYEEYCANLEKKLELYNTVLKMFEEAIAKKHARK